MTTWNFYPRSPYGERRYIIEHDLNNTNISIHALLTESDGRTKQEVTRQ